MSQESRTSDKNRQLAPIARGPPSRVNGPSLDVKSTTGAPAPLIRGSSVQVADSVAFSGAASTDGGTSAGDDDEQLPPIRINVRGSQGGDEREKVPFEVPSTSPSGSALSPARAARRGFQQAGRRVMAYLREEKQRAQDERVRHARSGVGRVLCCRSIGGRVVCTRGPCTHRDYRPRLERTKFGLEKLVQNARERHRRKPTAAAICCPCYLCAGPRTRATINWVLNHRVFSILMTVLTATALFGDDIGVLMPKAMDQVTNALLTVCLVFFMGELIALSSENREYVYTVLWWLDLIAAVSIFPDIGWTEQAVFAILQVNSGGGPSAAEQAWETARIGRLGRVVRVVRLVRVTRFTKFIRAKDKREITSEEDNVSVSRIGRRITRLITIKVMVSAMALILITPLLVFTDDHDSRTESLSVVASVDPGQERSFAAALGAYESAFPELVYLGNTTTVFVDESTAALRESDILDITSGALTAKHSLADEYFAAAWLSLLQTLIICIVLTGQTFSLTHDVYTLLVDPIERLTRMIRPLLSDAKLHKLVNTNETGIVMAVLTQMKDENSKMKEELGIDKKKAKVDFQTPIERAVETLESMKSKLSAEEKASIDEVIAKLTTANPFVPDIAAQLDNSGGGGKQNAELRRWVFSEVTKDSRRRNTRRRNSRARGASVLMQSKGAGNASWTIAATGMGGATGSAFAGKLRPDQLRMTPKAGRVNTILNRIGAGALFGYLPILLETLPESEDDLRWIMESLQAAPIGWNLDVIRLHELTNRPLQLLTYTYFRKWDVTGAIGIDDMALVLFMGRVEAGYREDNPYHNGTHAASVTNDVNHLMSVGGFSDDMEDFEIFAMLFSAAIHDFEHPGHTNNFEIQVSSKRALLYNDQSVLENHHVAAAFKLAMQDKWKLFRGVNDELYRKLRATIIELVLATDLKKHFAHVAALNSATAGENGGESLPLMMLMKTAMKIGDVAHTSKEPGLHMRWTQKITEEFYKQGDMERERGLKISPFMDRADTNLGSCQTGFLDFIVLPLFRAAAKIYSAEGLAPILKQLQSNHAHWQQIADEESRQSAAEGKTADEESDTTSALPTAGAPKT